MLARPVANSRFYRQVEVSRSQPRPIDKISDQLSTNFPQGTVASHDRIKSCWLGKRDSNCCRVACRKTSLGNNASIFLQLLKTVE